MNRSEWLEERRRGLGGSENWRVIPNYESYEVSDQGRVKRAKPGPGCTKGKILKPLPMRGGYLGVQLSLGKRGKVRFIQIHRLVLLTFKGEPPFGTTASHLNGVRADNRAINLEWETPTKNNHRKIEHGTLAEGERIASSKLTEQDVMEIRNKYKKNIFGLRRLAVIYAVRPCTIYDVIRGETWKNITNG